MTDTVILHAKESQEIHQNEKNLSRPRIESSEAWFGIIGADVTRMLRKAPIHSYKTQTLKTHLEVTVWSITAGHRNASYNNGTDLADLQWQTRSPFYSDRSTRANELRHFLVCALISHPTEAIKYNFLLLNSRRLLCGDTFVLDYSSQRVRL